jgi:hypothetical protein
MSAEAARAIQQKVATRALQVKVRRIVLTGAVAAITAVGAIYGAGLKTQKEEKNVRILSATSCDQYSSMLLTCL